ncbi:RRP15-like protein isoform X2 [Labrus mixtus]|uniref:RRP15-like protein isoform X2 n=1 Tax=Labrus mixtus TaxID=508554 RepID=UPI0029C07E58|nr:RRP15-like protein isoform X2 [Labrus mixtus]
MAALVKTHVQISDDAEPQVEDDSESGVEEDRDGDESSDGEEEGDEDGADDEDEEGADEEEDDGEEADAEDGAEEEKAEDGGDGNANAGWADAMAKILGKKTESESIILIKNKALEKMKERERQEQLERQKQVDKKRTWEMMSRVKPDVVKDRETERALQRVATRGVVQLFNAVRKHQKTVDEKVKEVGGSERKKAKLLSSVSKKDFIDVLRGSEGSQTPKTPAPVEDEKPSWSVLRDDFMMGASMKDWDKLSDEEAGSAGGAKQSDSD